MPLKKRREKVDFSSIEDVIINILSCLQENRKHVRMKKMKAGWGII